jgi:hypothetical protein
MSSLRDFLVAPRTGEATVDDGRRRPHRARAAASAEQAAVDEGRRRVAGARRTASSDAAPALSLGLLAPLRELPAAAAGAGLAIARAGSAALVCVHAPGVGTAAPSLCAPPRAGAARLAASLRARDLEASARGRLALVRLPDDRAQLAGAAARALAAAGPLPTVLAVAVRDDELDVLLAARDAILVALPPAAEPALAQLALAGAAALAPCAAALALGLDPVQRTLALAGLRAPRSIRDAVAGLVG